MCTNWLLIIIGRGPISISENVLKFYSYHHWITIFLWVLFTADVSLKIKSLIQHIYLIVALVTKSFDGVLFLLFCSLFCFSFFSFIKTNSFCVFSLLMAYCTALKAHNLLYFAIISWKKCSSAPSVPVPLQNVGMFSITNYIFFKVSVCFFIFLENLTKSFKYHFIRFHYDYLLLWTKKR